jgi:hypothetical protein
MIRDNSLIKNPLREESENINTEYPHSASSLKLGVQGSGPVLLGDGISPLR